jgi:hypothetical protein
MNEWGDLVIAILNLWVLQETSKFFTSRVDERWQIGLEQTLGNTE